MQLWERAQPQIACGLLRANREPTHVCTKKIEGAPLEIHDNVDGNALALMQDVADVLH